MARPTLIIYRSALILLGALFLVSAFLKSLDPTAFAAQISFFGLVRTPWVVRLAALVIIALEALLGAALLAGLALRRFALPAAALLLVAFTALLGWAWAYRNIQDCGCFGKYLPLTPGAAILKNVILLGLAGVVWFGEKSRSPLPGATISHRVPDSHSLSAHRLVRPTIVLLLTLAVTTMAAWRGLSHPKSNIPIQSSVSASSSPPAATGATTGTASLPPSPQSAAPFAPYRFSYQGHDLALAQGTFLVALFSESCVHCVDNLEALDTIATTPGLPPVVALVLGEEDVVKDFANTYQPKFPLKAMDVLEYMNLIGDASARFTLVKDGRALHFWDTLPPTPEALKAWLPQGER